MSDEDKKIPRRVGIDSVDDITFDIQFEYEKILADIRIEKDPFIVMDMLFEAITKLCSIITSSTESQDIKDRVETENKLLKSDEMSPKTTVENLYGEYHLRYDSYSVRCYPSEYDVSRKYMDREGERVTIRKLWAMLGRLQTIAYNEKIFQASFTLRGDEKHAR